MNWYHHQQALLRVAKEQLYLFDHISCPRIEVSPSLEYAACGGINEVKFQVGFVLNATYEEVVGVMRHELTHTWLFRKGYAEDSNNHGPRFLAKAKQVRAVLSAKTYPGIYYRVPKGFSYPEQSFLKAHGYRISQ